MKINSVDRITNVVTAIKLKPFVAQVSLACLAVFCVEALQPQQAMAKWFTSLYAGQYAWVTYTLEPGSYVLEASTLLNLGDVDIEIYDTNGQRFAKGTKVGSETIYFSVPQGGDGDFRIKYSMPFCINPAGACAVNISVSSR